MEELVLSNEEKARVFAMYAFAPFLFCYNIENKPVINPLGIGYKDLSDVNPDIENKRDLLLLTPLSAISDEDAIEVAGVYTGVIKNSFNIAFRRSNCIALDTIDERRRFVLHFSGDNSFLFTDGSNISSTKNEYNMFQYLISKSYAVPLFFSPGHPCNGKTALELNIAIDKTLLP